MRTPQIAEAHFGGGGWGWGRSGRVTGPPPDVLLAGRLRADGLRLVRAAVLVRLNTRQVRVRRLGAGSDENDALLRLRLDDLPGLRVEPHALACSHDFVPS